MFTKAIAKITSEMDANKSNRYVQAVGSFLLSYLNENKDAAEMIMAEDKTIMKSLDAMRKEAEKKKIGNYAVLTDEEGFRIVLNYFGITGAPIITNVPQEAPVKPKNDFNISLDDLL